ncbi:MAG: sugar transferase [Firmicutes bacterium]|nr:sugar transferase [Bacillota bacterium]
MATFGALMVGSYVAWNTAGFWQVPGIWPVSLAIGGAVLGGKAWLQRRVVSTPWERLRAVTAWVVAVYLCLGVYLLMVRSPYSRSFLLSSFVSLLLWQIVDALLISRAQRPARLAVVPGGALEPMSTLPGVELYWLRRPELETPVSGLVVDMHNPLPPEWTRFVAECAASGLPVYHAAAVYEAASSRVALSYLSHGLVGELFNGSSPYMAVKRLIDIACVLLSLPITLPIALITTIAIRLDSPGPVLFWQKRVGQGGRVFWLVKFRSMYTDSERNGARFAAAGDDRITRVGRVIRKLRIDELPQLWNVFKGEMSLIGPRPEQVPFVREFEEKIPFYRWRHRVKPGITGWAQVNQGYAAGVQDTMEKLEYDLYYIKHASIWLDLAIIVRTIRVMLTGHGAR